MNVVSEDISHHNTCYVACSTQHAGEIVICVFFLGDLRLYFMGYLRLYFLGYPRLFLGGCIAPTMVSR